jgi:hypothetical protein
MDKEEMEKDVRKTRKEERRKKGKSGRVKEEVWMCKKEGQMEKREGTKEVCREGLFLLPYNELAVAQGPKIYQKKAL